jgi:YgiT-type zinc finger domain-containing protein
MDAGLQNEENALMKCHVCGAEFQEIVTDLPFKLTDRAIVIIKDLPVHQCAGCAEYLLDDATLARVDELLAHADASAELEIIRYAA